jgi:predicted MFS family arabinose efflux permease
MSASMSSMPAPIEPTFPVPRARAIRPLPLLTLINYFNYLDRQVVYGMSPLIGDTFGLSKFQLGWLAAVNLVVFSFASLISGPVTDRIGPRKVIFAGILIWAAATIGSALAVSFPALLVCRALVGVGEGPYGPSANALLCADAPPSRRGRALGIYNLGMAFGGTSGLVLGGVLAPVVGWRGVFWVAGAPAVLLAAASAFIAAPPRIKRARSQPARAYLLSPTYLMALAGGTLAAFGANGLIFWARHLIVEDRHFSETVAGVFMGAVGLVAGAGGVVAGGYAGDALTRKRAGGHSLTIGVSMLVAAPLAALTLMVTSHPPFMVLTTVTVFFLSVYNGPAAAVVDELGPPHLAATLQAVFMFWLQLLGNTPAASVVGLIADHSSVPVGLQVTVVAFFLSGVLFLLVARWQRLAGGGARC